ncbi:MAG: hypothetical protein KF729_10205 [Sandaracinaceae bacterium]|nr:hypothetical protein [Sandaracinaceae bacterium]
MHELAWLDLAPHRRPSGDWFADQRGWRCRSAAEAVFAHVEDGRGALIGHARRLAANQERLSRDRVVVLADTGDGRHRLWELMRVEPTLEDRLRGIAPDAPPETVARLLRDAADHLLRARRTFEGEPSLPCSLRTVGGDMHRSPVFADLVPDGPAPTRPEERLLEEELGPIVDELTRARPDFETIRRNLLRAGEVRRQSVGLRVLLRLSS